MTKRLNSYWVKHERDAEKKESLEKTILNSTVALTRLDEILDEMIEAIATNERNVDQYDNPSWAYLQAHRNGELRALQNIKKLTDHLS